MDAENHQMSSWRHKIGFRYVSNCNICRRCLSLNYMIMIRKIIKCCRGNYKVGFRHGDKVS
jgi:hypothetical protein